MSYDEFNEKLVRDLLTRAQYEKLRENGDVNAAIIQKSDNTKDHPPVVMIRFSGANMTWLITELPNADDTIAFGLADLDMGSPEMGSVDLAEVAEVVRRAGGHLTVHDMPSDAAPLTVYADKARKSGAIDFVAIYADIDASKEQSRTNQGAAP